MKNKSLNIFKKAENPGPSAILTSMLTFPKCQTFIKCIYTPLSCPEYSVVATVFSNALNKYSVF